MVNETVVSNILVTTELPHGFGIYFALIFVGKFGDQSGPTNNRKIDLSFSASGEISL